MATENPTAMVDPIGYGTIGNYKGVMLCNRPSEPGEIVLKDR